MEQDWADLFYPKGIPEVGQKSLAVVRDAFAELGRTLQRELPPGRYKAMVKTDLEKTAAIATKAFSHE